MAALQSGADARDHRVVVELVVMQGERCEGQTRRVNRATLNGQEQAAQALCAGTLAIALSG